VTVPKYSDDTLGITFTVGGVNLTEEGISGAQNGSLCGFHLNDLMGEAVGIDPVDNE
jgi:hypothetical protein